MWRCTTTLRPTACVNDFTGCSRQPYMICSRMETLRTIYIGLYSGCVQLLRRTLTLCLPNWFSVNHSMSLGIFCWGAPLLNPVWLLVLFSPECLTAFEFQVPVHHYFPRSFEGTHAGLFFVFFVRQDARHWTEFLLLSQLWYGTAIMAGCSSLR